MARPGTPDSRFRSSFDQIAVGIAYTTIDGRILETNHKLCEMLGYSWTELLGMTTRELTHPEDRDQQDALRHELLNGVRSHFSGDKRYVRKDGSEIWVSRTVARAQTPGGEPYLIQTIEDINERKHTEAGLQRLSRARRVTAACSHILVHASNEIDMLNSMCSVVVGSGGYKQAWIGVPTGEPARPVRIVAHAGYGDDQPMTAPGTWTADGRYQGSAAIALTSGKTFIQRDIMHNEQHLRMRPRASKYGYQSSIALPLASGGKTVGVLVLHAAERDAFDDDEIKLLHELAIDIGFGISNLHARATQQLAEQRSRENEKRFREVFEQAAVGITRVDLNGRLADCNQKFSDLLGYTREELLGMAMRDLTHPDDYGSGAQYRMQLAQGGSGSRSDEKRFIRKDGTPVWTRRTMSTAFDAAGQPQYIIGVIENITDWKELEQHHRETFNQAAVGIVHTSGDGRYLRVNRRFCEMLGYSEEELLGHKASEFSLSEDHVNDEKNRLLMWEGKLSNLNEEKQYIRKDGSTVWTNRTVSLARDAAGNPLFFIRVIEDITARKEADLRYRATVDHAPMGIMHTAIGSYKILRVNPKLCAMIGYTEDELLNMTSTEIVHPEYRFKDRARYQDLTLPDKAPSFSSERMFLRKDGSVFWGNRTVSMVRDVSGNPLYHIRIIEDITERKQAEELIARERALLRTIIDALPDYIYVKDRAGTFMLANQVWLEARGIKHEQITGKTAFDFFPKETAERMHAQDVDIINGGTPLFNSEQLIPAKAADGRWTESRWVATTKVPLRAASGEVIGTAGISRDITEQKLRATRRLMEHTVTSALSETTTLVEAMPRILQIMCEGMGWNYGAHWSPDEMRKSLQRSAHWCATEPDFDEADRPFWHKLDDVGPGSFLRRVWNEKTACWLVNVQNEKFKRKPSAIKLGWHSAYAFPILIDNNIIGILEFFGSQTREPDTALLQVTTAISSQIGQFIQRKQAEDKLNFLARFDTITNLPNRYLFTDRLGQMLAQARRNDWSTGILFVDLDRFKAVNDTYGHAAGDELLRQAAARMQTCVRSSDTVGRLSGDEFAVMLASLAKTDDAGMVAQKIVETLAAPFNLNGHQAYISASVGIALYPSDGETADVLLKNADTAMYRAKAQGRNGYQFYLPQMNERLIQRQQLEAQLRGALERREFMMHYQPKADLSSGTVTGFEALLRWNSSEGLVSPAEFITVLEETGLIVPVGDWILDSVCAQLSQWKQDGVPLRPVAVNLSARQFQVKNLAEVVGRTLQRHDVSPGLLKLELTESLLMSDAQESVETLHQLKSLGVQLSVDDFGTGYSSLAYLKRFPLDELKIDREFIRDAISDPDDAAIVVTIINLAHSLKLKVVAEGLETEGQLNFLRFHGCDEIQGYYFSQPLPAEKCASLLNEGKRLPQTQNQITRNSVSLLLVVENEQEMQLLTQAFAPAGFYVMTARNAKDGFEILARQSIDVVISDNDMTEMSGIQFLTRVRKLYANTLRVLASSGDDTPTLTRATNMAGIHLFLPKSWSAERLCTEVRDTLQTYVDATTSSGPHPAFKSAKD